MGQRNTKDKTILTRELATKLKQARVLSKKTVDSVAMKTGLSIRSIYILEERETKYITIPVLQKLADFYEIPISDFLNSSPTLLPEKVIELEDKEIMQSPPLISDILDLEEIVSNELFDESKYRDYYRKAMRQYKELGEDSIITRRMLPRLVYIESLIDNALIKCIQVTDEKIRLKLFNNIEILSGIHQKLSEGIKILPKQKSAKEESPKGKELTAFAIYQKAKVERDKNVDRQDKEEEELLKEKEIDGD